MPSDLHGMNAGRGMTMQERRSARRRWRRKQRRLAFWKRDAERAQAYYRRVGLGPDGIR